MAKKTSAVAPVVKEVVTIAPAQTSPEWSDYVLSNFAEGETDAEGNPFIHGLRRVTELLLGPIVYSVSNVVEPPRDSNNFRATLEHVIKIKFEVDDTRTFGDAADVYDGNTDADYAQYAVATAATRAEGRALRKALKLRKIAAEESSSVPTSESGVDGMSTLSQKRLIEKLCRELEINVDAFLKLGQYKYDSMSQVRYDSAKLMIEYLNGLYKDPDKIPEAILGVAKATV